MSALTRCKNILGRMFAVTDGSDKVVGCFETRAFGHAQQGFVVGYFAKLQPFGRRRFFEPFAALAQVDVEVLLAQDSSLMRCLAW